MREQTVDDLDRLLGIVDRDVDVEAEDELPAGHVLHLVDQVPVTVAGGDPLPLEEAEGVRARGPDAQVVLACDLGHVRTQAPQLAVDITRGPAHGGRDLQDRLHQLRVDVGLELVSRDRRQHSVDVLDEVEALAVEQHVLLLDSERVRLALPECMVEDAAARREALAGDRRRIDLLHHRQYPSFAAVFSPRGRRRPLRSRRGTAGRAGP